MTTGQGWVKGGGFSLRISSYGWQWIGPAFRVSRVLKECDYRRAGWVGGPLQGSDGG